MKSDRWQKLKNVFNEALERDPAQRAVFLDEACAGDAALREEVESLLASHQDADGFLEEPAYSSPEQLLGLEVDFRTDIFSFGIMLYELASGTHPFAATDSVTTIARILEAEPVELMRLRPVIPPELDQIVRRCLRKSPAQRYGQTSELVADLVEEVVDNGSLNGQNSGGCESPPEPAHQEHQHAQLHHKTERSYQIEDQPAVQRRRHFPPRDRCSA